MRKPKVYLETTMFNFYYADDAPEKRQDTIKLFKEIKEGHYEPYTSQYVVEELEKAPDQKKVLMLGLINQFNIKTFDADSEAERLAELYVTEGIIPQKYSTDALHIAIATVKNMDFRPCNFFCVNGSHHRGILSSP